LILLYNSDAYAVMQFDVDGAEGDSATTAETPKRGGYEIVDKMARKGIFLEGAMANAFREGVQSLGGEPSSEDVDDYISRYSALAQQPITLH